MISPGVPSIMKRIQVRLFGGFVASGRESNVYELPGHPDKVISFQKAGKRLWGETQAEQTYAIHRILNILFPKNFPRIYAVFASKREDRKRFFSEESLFGRLIANFPGISGYGAIREKVDILDFEEEGEFDFVTKDYGEFGKLIFNELDPGDYNFATSANNEVVYLDLLPTLRENSPAGNKWTEDFIRDFIASENLVIDLLIKRNESPESIAIVVNSFTRLRNCSGSIINKDGVVKTDKNPL